MDLTALRAKEKEVAAQMKKLRELTFVISDAIYKHAAPAGVDQQIETIKKEADTLGKLYHELTA